MTIEELQEELLQMKEQLKTLNGDNENLKKQVEEKSSRVQDLETYNQKLFLRATATKKEEPKKEEFQSKLLGDYASLLSEEEIELLQELEEEL